MTDVKFRNVKLEDLDDAVWCVQHFAKTYPERRGVNNGCAYAKQGYQSYYVYRLTTMFVCVGQ